MLSERPVDILLVDDQPENLLALEAVLDGTDRKLIRAGSGREALKCMLEGEFAIVILDVQMPDMNGFEVASAMRQREITKHTPIIFLTAKYTEDKDVSAAYALGAIDFITKPFESEILKSKVQVFVELHKKTLEITRQAELIAQKEREKLEAEKQLIEEALLRKEMERQLLEERSKQLAKADKLKTEFLANMSHEIRTPINGVIGMAELLLHTQMTGEQREFAQIIRESAQALLIIINDILDLSKIEAGHLDLESIDFDVVRLVEGTGELLMESARAKKLVVMTFVDPLIPNFLKGDPGRLRQVMLNLIGNAMKFTEKGEVTIRATRVEDDGAGKIRVRFSVTDTGIGLSEQVMVKLFRPFSQADGSTTRRFGGTGLGLSISKRLVEMMGGQIGVNSQLGEGSTFWFEVPFPIGNSTEEAIIDTRGFEQTKILAVDDLASARKILQTYICSWGMQCDTAASANEALFMLKREAACGKPYDLVITDFIMPEVDGFKLLEAVREDNNLAYTKFILCTGYDTHGQAKSSLDRGFEAYITKPIQQSRLFSVIAKISVDRDLGQRSVAPDSKRIEKRTLQSGSNIQSLCVLLAEDNLVNQKVANAQLNKLGLSVVTVANGEDAVDEVARKHYELVIMDCQMPRMDGFEATRTIRRAEAFTGRHIPIIGLTAHAMDGDKERCLAAGMDDYLSKPASLEGLSKVLEKWLDYGGAKDYSVLPEEKMVQTSSIKRDSADSTN